MMTRRSSPAFSARPAVASAALLALVAGATAPPAHAQGQPLEVSVRVPGLGEPVANGIYFFKFAIVGREDGVTYWSHDGTSVDGGEPDSALPLPVDAGAVTVILGEPPFSGQPDIGPELVQRDDVVLRVWYAGSHDSRFRKLPDRRLRGRGFSHFAESARDAERLEGKRASDFEQAGAVWRHEQDHEHTAAGRIPGGRFHHGSSDVAAGRELRVHFEVPYDEAEVRLSLHASPAAGGPAVTDLRMRTARTVGQLADTAAVDVVDYRGSGWLMGLRETWDFCNTCFKRKLPPDTEVYLDGIAFEDWKVGRDEVTEDMKEGRVDNLALLGLVAFNRSLKVVSRHRGVADASGVTAVWYYTSKTSEGVPGALQVLLDGADITPALSARPEADGANAPALGRLLLRRHDGEPPSGRDRGRGHCRGHLPVGGRQPGRPGPAVPGPPMAPAGGEAGRRRLSGGAGHPHALRNHARGVRPAAGCLACPAAHRRGDSARA